ncbi:S8 family peptidase [Gracilibacillus suaedae]|uniref:S8 family peptidase n=1 Tax=Gracilibacillus suaedae TaxID=2820273 RepID=UPI001ABDDEA0|nr:S8 family serine peptidase [Gracilibacillus suaedae]
MMNKRLILLLLIFLLGGCNERDKETQDNLKDSEECTNNWAICMVNPEMNFNLLNSTPVKVAILDSGINYELDELKDYVVKRFNTTDNSSTTIPVNEHGTMIASIVAATNKGNTKIGLNESVQLYDVQVLNNDAKGQVENTVTGINWAIEQDVDIINISYGFSNDIPSFKKAIKTASDKGIIIVAATGNTIGLSTDFPAKYPDVLSISAIDNEMDIFSYAGKGKVDYVAPGVNVPVLNMQGEIEYQSGTSFAAAYATGVISLFKSQTINEDVIQYLQENSIELGSKNTYGQGLIQFREEY